VTDLADLPVRMLIAQLAQIEDAIRTTPTFTTATDGPAPLNGDLLALLARERDIIAELRRPADPIERTREPRAARISNAHAWRDVSPTRAEGFDGTDSRKCRNLDTVGRGKRPLVWSGSRCGPEVWPDLEVRHWLPLPTGAFRQSGALPRSGLRGF